MFYKNHTLIKVLTYLILLHKLVKARIPFTCVPEEFWDPHVASLIFKFEIIKPTSCLQALDRITCLQLYDHKKH